jgi:methylmalonyl-CoA/ethylmalonyl-CoA epimerase
MSGKNPPVLMFDHIGIVTSDTDHACRQFGSTIGAVEISERFDDSALGVSVQFIRDRAGIVYEMISPLGEKSPVAKALATKTNILNQICYRTASIAEAAAELRELGNMPLGPAKPALAFDGALVQFFFCRLGFVIELIEIQAYKREIPALPGACVAVWHRFQPAATSEQNSSKTRGG